MPQVIERIQGSYEWIFFCPACSIGHFIDARWQFNGDVEKPTITPSVDCRYELEGVQVRCHFYVRDGKIEFCNDSTHELAGKTVELPTFPGK